MFHFLFKSSYRFLNLGLIVGLIGLWYLWYTTDQIVTAGPIVLTTGLVVLNLVLSFFAFDRHTYITRFIFIFTYIILGLILYSLYTLSRGVQ